MASPSQTPVRYPSGVSTDSPTGPLANYGLPNPFFYQTLFDDLFEAPALSINTTTSLSGTGAAVTGVSGDGGIWQLTTSTAGAGTAGIIGSNNNFVIPPALYTGTGVTAQQFSSKKLFFATRINVTNVAAETITAGFMPANTVAALPTDGIFFNLTSAVAGTLQARAAGVTLWSIPLPLAGLSGGVAYANNQWVDLAIYYDRLQNVYAFVGFPLFGFLPASAWTGVTNLNSQPPPLGALAAYNVQVSGAWTPSTAVLTAGVIAAGTIQTTLVDFIFAAKER